MCFEPVRTSNDTAGPGSSTDICAHDTRQKLSASSANAGHFTVCAVFVLRGHCKSSDRSESIMLPGHVADARGSKCHATAAVQLLCGHRACR